MSPLLKNQKPNNDKGIVHAIPPSAELALKAEPLPGGNDQDLKTILSLWPSLNAVSKRAVRCLVESLGIAGRP